MNSPMDLFFKMGEKATRGDPARQADFIYYMVWIIFIAFAWLFFHNAYQLFWNGDLNAATWTLVGFAICVIQYFSLKGMYEMKKMREQSKGKVQDKSLDSVDEMMKSFDKREVVKNVRK